MKGIIRRNYLNRLIILSAGVMALFCLTQCGSSKKVQNKMEASSVNGYPEFEDGMTWIFEDGQAKVKTFDGVEASMKASDVPGYLKKYKNFRTTRMSVRYMYPITLDDVLPFAEQLDAVGIKTEIATNDEMLKTMTMPEYRRAYIYDEGNGQYRFELNCNSQEDNYMATMLKDYKLKYQNLSATGNLALMKRWITVFDGHGIAIFPNTMPVADVQQMAEAAWKRGINQIAVVVDQDIVTIPENSRLTTQYQGMDAKSMAQKMIASISTDYFDKGLHIKNPKSFYNSNSSFFNVTDVIRTPDELILVYRAHQGPDLWLTRIYNDKLVANGNEYPYTRAEGLEGFEVAYYWSPVNGYYTMTEHFPAIPDDVKTVDIYDIDDNQLVIKGLQVSQDITDMSDIRTVYIVAADVLKTVHLHEDMPDIISVKRADFTDKETTIYVEMAIMEPHSFLGHVGSDFTLTLGNGQVLKPIRVEGVPVDEDFDRHGDHVTTYFQLIFPAISEQDWESQGERILKGTICHEPLTFNLQSFNFGGTIEDILEQLKNQAEQE